MAHSISSTGDSPSPVILKRKRTTRHRTLPSASSNTSEEEADMANCLILLAQGHTFPLPEASNPIHECKTCSRTFASFQALGGHRASHKKPKIAASEAEISSSIAKQMDSSSSGSGKQRTHDCSICGSEFSSGQALGGHMRRHRPAVLSENDLEIHKKNQKRILLLDLNLPAPAEDEPFVAGKPPPAAALVDCHY